jgi:hypothetical protein
MTQGVQAAEELRSLLRDSQTECDMLRAHVARSDKMMLQVLLARPRHAPMLPPPCPLALPISRTRIAC